MLTCHTTTTTTAYAMSLNTTPISVSLNPQAANDDPYIADLDRVLDTLREKVLDEGSPDIFDSLASHIEVLRKNKKTFETCDKIIPKVSHKLLERALTIIILGASGDLAQKKTVPALFQLYCAGLLPLEVNIVGYARTTIDDVEKWKRERLVPKFENLQQHRCHVDNFLSRISFLSGQYDNDDDFRRLNEFITEKENAYQGAGKGGNRLFYLALPSTTFVMAVRSIHNHAMPREEECWMRVIIEKPFGTDTQSSRQLSKDLEAYLPESSIYRIDHYLGKEMVQNIITTRFANRIFSAIWNANNIACVQITFKEMIGTEGRGKYFDSFGIIRDVVQNHLTQILALVAMAKPHNLNAEEIRDEKVELLRCIEPVKVENCVLGQYTASADGSMPGYLDDPTVPAGSKCPTYAVMRLDINNDRWHGVPFILKAGKALEEKFVGIRIQFKDEIRPYGDATTRNELVIRAQPYEAMYIKITTKEPGLMEDLASTHQTELDLTYRHRFNVRLPDAYESLISNAIQGNSTNFVRKDELDAAWKIFTPLLHQIDSGAVPVYPYVANTRGPIEGDNFILRNGFKLQEGYHWVVRENKL